MKANWFLELLNESKLVLSAIDVHIDSLL